jgi:peptide chain release factor 3
LREEVELAEAACPPLDLDSFHAGHLTPVLFGSALRNVGVRELLDVIAELSPAPGGVKATTRLVEPDEAALTGFVFKIQANMDPNHRDRMAFFRICSGRLGRGMRLKLVRTGKMLTVQNPVFFFARDRELAEEAWPGDVVGLPNHGSLRIGDTLTEGEDLHFSGIPSFAPELIRRPRLEDPQQAKKLKHALEQLAEEGVMQLFKPIDGSSWLIGVVGPLQLDVLQGRLQAEYGVSVTFEQAAGQLARWVTGTEPAELERFMRQQRDRVAEDRDGAPVYLAPNAWHVRDTEQSWPELRFLTVREQHAL